MAEPERPGTETITVTSAFPPRDTAPGGYLEPIRAAGAVLWRDTGHGREVALIHRPGRDDWTLPKGKLKNGEHILTAAVREVSEETGLLPVLGRRLPPQRYLKDGWPKQVEWWAATPSPAASRFTPNEEVDALEWTPLDAARERLSYDHDVHVLDNFRAGPARTVPLVLLRHASAGDKRDWNDHDLLRPLDETGRADALALAETLAVFGPLRVVSSAAARCTETVVPYTVTHAAEIRTERAFTVGALASDSGSFDRAAARAAFGALLDERGPTLVCTHGELVADLMREAFDRLDSPVPQQLSLRKGTFWVMHVDAEDGSLAAVERHTRVG
ncbi:NUDIX hydrolase [Thermobifida halotolerans]|uniref:NUDIX hydrolase n=1 Tax=Thermobifida halotolerans TaxID=483545 RepID=A0A399FYQ0_9ACTN|nr:NUDIX domain-containing protein [Thermobifida halotolerans]UOE19394.1 NUDIX hydrolase [Thermobifida halotolerans]